MSTDPQARPVMREEALAEIHKAPHASVITICAYIEQLEEVAARGESATAHAADIVRDVRQEYDDPLRKPLGHGAIAACDEILRRLLKAQAASLPAEPATDGTHFVPCPRCNGTGLEPT